MESSIEFSDIECLILIYLVSCVHKFKFLHLGEEKFTSRRCWLALCALQLARSFNNVWALKECEKCGLFLARWSLLCLIVGLLILFQAREPINLSGPLAFHFIPLLNLRLVDLLS